MLGCHVVAVDGTDLGEELLDEAMVERNAFAALRESFDFCRKHLTHPVRLEGLQAEVGLEIPELVHLKDSEVRAVVNRFQGLDRDSLWLAAGAHRLPALFEPLGSNEEKMAAVHSLPSQVYEGGASGSEAFEAEVPDDEAGRRAWAQKLHGGRNAAVANTYRDALVSWYGPERGKKVKYAEAFEICEYGRQPDRDELRKLFPFFGP